MDIGSGNMSGDEPHQQSMELNLEESQYESNYQILISESQILKSFEDTLKEDFTDENAIYEESDTFEKFQEHNNDQILDSNSPPRS